MQPGCILLVLAFNLLVGPEFDKKDLLAEAKLGKELQAIKHCYFYLMVASRQEGLTGNCPKLNLPVGGLYHHMKSRSSMKMRKTNIQVRFKNKIIFFFLQGQFYKWKSFLVRCHIQIEQVRKTTRLRGRC